MKPYIGECLKFKSHTKIRVRGKECQARMIEVGIGLVKENERILQLYGEEEYAARWKRIEESFTVNDHRKVCNEEYVLSVKSTENSRVRVSKDGVNSGIHVTAEISGNVRFSEVKKMTGDSGDLEKELHARSIPIPRKDSGELKFKDAKSFLKSNEADMTGILVADCKSFKPKSTGTFTRLLKPSD